MLSEENFALNRLWLAYIVTLAVGVLYCCINLNFLEFLKGGIF